MRLLGLDVGDRRIGVSLSDSLGLTAQPLTVVERRREAEALSAIRALVSRHQVEKIIVGLPLTMRGTPGPQSDKVTAFVEALRRQVTVPIQLLDERLTTVQGTRTLQALGTTGRRRKQLIDQVAAQLILQQFLDTHRQAGSSQ